MTLTDSELGKEYLKFCDIKAIALKTKTLDLSKVYLFYPTSILPLEVFIRENKDMV